MGTGTLEQIKVKCQVIADKYLLDGTAEVEQWVADMLEVLEVSVRGYLFGEDIKEIEVEYPADWWESFKDRWFPKWWLKKHPITKETVKLEAKLLYTEFKPLIPKEKHKIIFDSHIVRP